MINLDGVKGSDGQLQPDLKHLAYTLHGHLEGIGHICTIIWRQYGVSRGIGRAIDLSGWHSLVLIANELWCRGGFGEPDPSRCAGVAAGGEAR